MGRTYKDSPSKNRNEFKDDYELDSFERSKKKNKKRTSNKKRKKFYDDYEFDIDVNWINDNYEM